MSVFYRLSARKSLVALTLPVVNKVIFPFISFQFHIIQFEHRKFYSWTHFSQTHYVYVFRIPLLL